MLTNMLTFSMSVKLRQKKSKIIKSNQGTTASTCILLLHNPLHSISENSILFIDQAVHRNSDITHKYLKNWLLDIIQGTVDMNVRVIVQAFGFMPGFNTMPKLL